MKKYIIYKIINKVNNMVYIGCHVTTNINDSYMGSGKYLKRAIKKYGIENFEKMILYVYDNREEMINKEIELVNEEFIKQDNTYNLVLGGGNTLSKYVAMKDKNGKCIMVLPSDKRYLAGELVGITKGMVTVKDNNGNIFNVKLDDKRYINGDLVSLNKGKIPVKDINNKFYLVEKTDPRYLSGELIPAGMSISITDEHKKKISEANKIKQKGVKNSQYGTCWITKDNINKKIKKEDINNYLDEGWIRGRVI